MFSRRKFDRMLRPLTLLCVVLCLMGALASVFVILVRVPAVATTKLELLFGTLQGVSVALLFGIAALLVTLTYMVRRASNPPTPMAGDRHIGAGQASG
jgi:hypothetical protein